MSRVFVILTAFLVSACDSSLGNGQLCTEIGCDSGLIVRLSRPPDPPYRVELRTSSASPQYARECTASAPCGSLVFFPDFTPDLVHVRVIVLPDTFAVLGVRPQYTESRPNGPGCEPLCRIATVDVTVP